MQKFLIVGSGYVGEYLIDRLSQKAPVQAWRRQHPQNHQSSGKVVRLAFDLDTPSCSLPNLPEAPYCLIYSAPPSPMHEDHRLKHFIERLTRTPEQVIYLSSTGVYGDHQGQWVTEQSDTLGHEARHQGRLDAEKQWIDFCKASSTALTIARIAGIYGPNRLHLSRLIDRRPLICHEQSPFSNRIHVEDLADILTHVCLNPMAHGIVNISDGNTNTFTQWYELLAKLTGHSVAGYEDAQTVFAQTPSRQRSFLEASRRLDTQKLKSIYPRTLRYQQWEHGLKSAIEHSNDIAQDY